MAKRRDQIAMSRAEFWTFAESQKSIHVATIQRDGRPHLVPLWFAIDGGAFVLETFTKSQKVKNLERDPRITLMLESGEEYAQLRGATIYAEAELVRDVERVHELHLKVLLRNSGDIPREILEKASRGMAPKKTAILVVPQRVISWDHSKLGGIY